MSIKVNQDASEKKRWGMVVDLNRCVGCQTCTIACKQTNDTAPGVQWRKVIDIETGSFPDVQRLFMVTGCQHCDEPPCVPVCPTGATTKREDGIVAIDYDQCIGCAYCAVSCPYEARTLIHDDLGYYGKKTTQENATAHPERIGVAQKCTFCQPKIDDGLARGLKPGIDFEATPACAASCIAQAINFGDFNDLESNVSVLSRNQPTMRLNENVGTEPQIKYLYTTPSILGRDLVEKPFSQAKEALYDKVNPVVGSLQNFWDWRAAMNWMFGGMGSGLLVLTSLFTATNAIPLGLSRDLILCALVSISVGLFFVFLKIGRKIRFWRAILRPQSSWMTRELYVVAFLFPVSIYTAFDSNPLNLCFTAFFALCFLYCQSMILYKARGIPAWRVPDIPWMIFFGGLMEGFGLLIIFLAFQGLYLHPPLLILSSSILAGISFILWYRYLVKSEERLPPLAVAVLKSSSPLLSSIAIIMVGVMVYGLLVPKDAHLLFALFGISAITFGFVWKFIVIVKASYFNGLTYNFSPRRGSGDCA